MLAPEVEQRPWTEQFSLDAVHYKVQINYLFTHSELYRTKFKADNITSAEAAGGLRSIAQLPFTEKNEIRAPAVRQKIPSVPISASNAPTSSASIPPAAPQERQVTFPSQLPISTDGPPHQPAAIPHPACRSGCALSPPTTQGLSWRAQRWAHSTSSACVIFPLAPATPSA